MTILRRFYWKIGWKLLQVFNAVKIFQLSFPLTLSCALPWSDTYSVWVILSQEGALNSKFSWNLWILRKKSSTWDCGKRQENRKKAIPRPKCPSKFVKRPWFKPMEGLVLPVTAFMSFASILWLVVKFGQKPFTIIQRYLKFVETLEENVLFPLYKSF